jgi:hypothetical protein
MSCAGGPAGRKGKLTRACAADPGLTLRCP